MSPDLSTENALRERQRKILRIAVGVALGLAVAEAQEKPFSFLTPLFAFQVLMNMPAPPSPRQGLGFVLVIVVASGVALGLANALQETPIVYLIVLGLIFFGCFLMQLTGKGGPLPGMLLACNAMVPVIAVISRDLAQDFVGIMIFSAVSAVLLAWLAHALFPASIDAAEAGSRPGQLPAAIDQIRAALACTFISMPVVVHYLSDDREVSIVVLITIITVLGQRAEMRQRTAFGLLLGNLIGGLLASIVYYATAMVPWLPFLFLVTLAAALLLSEGATRATPEAPVFAIAMPTFLILLSLGLTPITDGSGAAFVSRFVDVALASLYALMGIILLLPRGGIPADRRGAAA
jgi:hypothetical protein